MDDEETDYKTAEELARYSIIPTPESRPESKDEGQVNTLTASPAKKEPPLVLNRLRRLKKTYRAP